MKEDQHADLSLEDTLKEYLLKELEEMAIQMGNMAEEILKTPADGSMTWREMARTSTTLFDMSNTIRAAKHKLSWTTQEL